MSVSAILKLRSAVALLAEGVDRNHWKGKLRYMDMSVALLAEGVDRNCRRLSYGFYVSVALLAEGVDRNEKHLDKRE